VANATPVWGVMTSRIATLGGEKLFLLHTSVIPEPLHLRLKRLVLIFLEIVEPLTVQHHPLVSLSDSPILTARQPSGQSGNIHRSPVRTVRDHPCDLWHSLFRNAAFERDIALHRSEQRRRAAGNDVIIGSDVTDATRYIRPPLSLQRKQRLAGLTRITTGRGNGKQFKYL